MWAPISHVGASSADLSYLSPYAYIVALLDFLSSTFFIFFCLGLGSYVRRFRSQSFNSFKFSALSRFPYLTSIIIMIYFEMSTLLKKKIIFLLINFFTSARPGAFKKPALESEFPHWFVLCHAFYSDSNFNQYVIQSLMLFCKVVIF